MTDVADDVVKHCAKVSDDIGGGPDTVLARDAHQQVTQTQTGRAYRRVLLRCPRVSVLWSASANKPIEKLSNS